MTRATFTIGLILFSCAVAALPVHRASAAIIYSDTFDRSNTNNIDASLSGITDNTGSSLPVDGVYSTPWVDPANQAGGPDGNAANGGGQRINNNAYEKFSPGTANLFVNHNFINPEILTAGGFSVSLDVLSTSTSNNGRGAAIAIGMSQSEAQSGHDGFDGNPAPVAKYSNAFFDGPDAPFTTGAVLSDFYFALRGNSSVAWGSGTATPTSVAVAAKTGTLSADFTFSSFSAGATVNYTVRYNGVAQGTGTFTWSGTNENYVGIDARDGTLVRMDNFSVTTIPEPATAGLIASLIVSAAVCGCRWTNRRESLNDKTND
jgi:hypothetical protein